MDSVYSSSLPGWRRKAGKEHPTRLYESDELFLFLPEDVVLTRGMLCGDRRDVLRKDDGKATVQSQNELFAKY